MVSYSDVKASNAALPTTYGPGYVAVFTGATSGIGEATLKALASRLKGVKVYIVGRNESSASPLIADLRQRCPDGTFTFIETEIGLLKNADAIAAQVKAKESKIDLLWCSAGFLNFTGARQETAEGLDVSMTTRYYSRMRLLQQLLPLLSAGNGRVVSCLAAGKEGALNEDDLDLKDPKNYGLIKAAVHTSTMMTLTMDVWAEQHPNVSFIHFYPGVVITPSFSKGHSGGLFGWFIQYVVPILSWPISISLQESGDRGLFFCTASLYKRGPAESGEKRSKSTRGGAYNLHYNGESVGDEQLLNNYHEKSVDQKVLNFLQQKFDTLIK
ncbi:MAG: hypothetical protein M1814_004798 [Vezdaea aestivalis]|nr:MAG: hypothetical protein M1814_004798 [Vezdaea aestivalis]